MCTNCKHGICSGCSLSVSSSVQSAQWRGSVEIQTGGKKIHQTRVRQDRPIGK